MSSEHVARGAEAGRASDPYDAEPTDDGERRVVALVRQLESSPDVRDQLEGLLEERHDLYVGRGQASIARIRGWALLALGNGVLSDRGLRFVLEELESGSDAYLVAAAACALRCQATPRGGFVPFLLRAITNIRYADDALDLSTFGGRRGDGVYRTTALDELVKALDWAGDAIVVAAPRLRALLSEPSNGLSPRIARALGALLDRAGAREATPAPKRSCCCGGGSGPRAPATPVPGVATEAVTDIELEDQDGRRVRFDEFFGGGPVIVVFFYTRCDNPRKCPLTMTKLARVQARLRLEGLGGAIRTAAITYDPAYDLPSRLRAWGASFGVVTDADHRILRTIGPVDPIRAHFDLGVNYVGSIVNRHQIEAYVVDRGGRIAARETRLEWDEGVLIDLARALLPA